MPFGHCWNLFTVVSLPSTAVLRSYFGLSPSFNSPTHPLYSAQCVAISTAPVETFLASLDTDPDAHGLRAYVQRELYDYLQCGVLAHGFLRLGCDTCHHELLLEVRIFSAKCGGV